MVRSPSSIATLLVSGPDRRGLVAALAQVLYGHGANILQADQYADVDSEQFFQRICFDLTDAHTDRVAIERALGEVSVRLRLTLRLEFAERRKQGAIFVSRHGPCLYDFLWRHRHGELACDVRAIVANHPDLEDVARQFAIPFHFVAVPPDAKGRAEAEQRALLESYGVDLVVFARYMQIVSSEFLA